MLVRTDKKQSWKNARELPVKDVPADLVARLNESAGFEKYRAI